MFAKPLFRMGIGADVVKLDRKVRYAAAQAFMNRLRRNSMSNTSKSIAV